MGVEPITEAALREAKRLPLLSTPTETRERELPMTNTERSYVEAFKQWMTEWKPHAFATFNLPNARRAPRDEAFYLTLWTRTAEADVLGTRTLKNTEFDRDPSRVWWKLPDGVTGG